MNKYPKPDSRANCLRRIELAREAVKPRHWYGTDGEGRRQVRIMGANNARNGLLGGALRDARPVHECGEWYVKGSRNWHQGWYTDPDGISSRDGTGLCWGMVAYLGHNRWLAGYEMGGTDSGAVYHLDAIYDSERDAAFAADGIAQRLAEQERDYQQRYNEALDLQGRIEERQQRLAECMALRNDKRPCFAGLRDEARECIEAIRKARETLDTDYAGVL